jgi:methylated-DNA-protein-cysteine methyltransferase related protein
MKTPTDFSQKVLKLIQSIPKGKVATYGQIAEFAGKPHGSRGVGWLLHSCTKSHRLPWQRVLGAKGKISFLRDSMPFLRQKKLLQNEGVVVSESGKVDLGKYAWKKSAPKRGKARSLLGRE